MSEKKDAVYYIALITGSIIIILITGITIYFQSKPEPAPKKVVQVIYIKQHRVFHHQEKGKFYSGGYTGQ